VISPTNSGTFDIITGTITSIPAGLTGTTLPGTSYTANEWVTTTDGNHHTTLLPVIVVGGGRGIVFWSLPLTPDVEFSFPGFPKFYLPCIKIFGISISDCKSPPATDGPPPDNSPTDSPTNSPTNGEPVAIATGLGGS